MIHVGARLAFRTPADELQEGGMEGSRGGEWKDPGGGGRGEWKDPGE